jgi:CheY-like chemotaxis protein
VARILVAGDDRDVRGLLAFWLARDGHEIVVAPDRPDEVDDVPDSGSGGFDLVVLDCHRELPACAEMADVISGHPDHGDAPIVLLSASSEEPEPDGAATDGVAAHLTRPFPLRRLSATIDQVLRDQRAGV